MTNALHSQLLRGFRAACRTAGLPLAWNRPGLESTEFTAISNSGARFPDQVDRNTGADTPVTITAAVVDFPELPGQGDIFTGAGGLSYRVGAIPPRDPSHPLITFTIDSAVTLP